MVVLLIKNTGQADVCMNGCVSIICIWGVRGALNKEQHSCTGRGGCTAGGCFQSRSRKPMSVCASTKNTFQVTMH